MMRTLSMGAIAISGTTTLPAEREGTYLKAEAGMPIAGPSRIRFGGDYQKAAKWRFLERVRSRDMPRFPVGPLGGDTID